MGTAAVCKLDQADGVGKIFVGTDLIQKPQKNDALGGIKRQVNLNIAEVSVHQLEQTPRPPQHHCALPYAWYQEHSATGVQGGAYIPKCYTLSVKERWGAYMVANKLLARHAGRVLVDAEQVNP